MGAEEKKMFITNSEAKQSQTDEKSDKTDEKSDKTDDKQPEKPPTSMKNIVCRRYLWAFGVYIMMFNFILYNLFNTAPFYLNKVYKAGELLHKVIITCSSSAKLLSHVAPSQSYYYM